MFKNPSWFLKKQEQFVICKSSVFKCGEIGTEVYSGMIIKKFENAREYIKFHQNYVRTLPDEMTIWMVIRHAPPLHRTVLPGFLRKFPQR
jgi:hypothetical protein